MCYPSRIELSLYAHLLDLAWGKTDVATLLAIAAKRRDGGRMVREAVVWGLINQQQYSLWLATK